MLGGQLVAFACGLLSVWVVWRLTRDLFDVEVANVAAFVFAILPIPRGNASDALSDTPHLLFYLLATWLACSAIVNGRLLLLAGVGLLSGIAYWIRPEGLEVAIVAIACLLWHAIGAHWGVRRTALAGVALAGMTLIVAAPYALLAGKVTSKQHPVAKAQMATRLIATYAKAETKPEPAPPPAVAPPQAQPDAAQAASAPKRQRRPQVPRS